MPEPKPFPYATHLNVLYAPLEVVEVQKLVENASVVPTGD